MVSQTNNVKYRTRYEDVDIKICDLALEINTYKSVFFIRGSLVYRFHKLAYAGDFILVCIMKNTWLYKLLIAAMVVGGFAPIQAQEKKPRLNHMALSVYNLEKSTVFYRDVLQLDTVPEPFHDGKHTWLAIGPNSHMHLIEGAASITEHDLATHLCFSVPSVTDFITRLDQFGIPYINWQREKQQVTIRVDGVKQIYLQDPDGYWIEINDDY